MAKRQGRRARPQEPREVDATALARQAGQFEAATGVPHGAAALAFVAIAALVVIPLRRIVSAIRRRRS